MEGSKCGKGTMAIGELVGQRSYYSMKEFRDYDEKLPELVYDILDYFRLGNRSKPAIQKSVLDYCTNSRFNSTLGAMVQPDVVHTICERLVKKGVLMCTKVGIGISGIDSNYLFPTSAEEVFLRKAPAIVFYFNCIVYGFPYIYSAYLDYVLPIIVKKDGKESMGTGFRYKNGIVTAKHCLKVDQVFIPNINVEKLANSRVYVSKDENLDLAYIDIGEPSPLVSNEAKVLDEVLVMGYPKIPMFFDFCAGERATISAIPTKGAIASIAEQYITRNIGPLILVTARIRGGNSGGPIIDANGAVVGVAFAEPEAKGDYDDMGYGIAYPIAVFEKMLQDPITLSVNFVSQIS